MHEVWALLNFLNPNIFKDEILFQNFFITKDILNEYLNNLDKEKDFKGKIIK